MFIERVQVIFNAFSFIEANYIDSRFENSQGDENDAHKLKTFVI